MAQNNPVNEQASYSTTGSANAPLKTDSSYGTNGSTTHPTTTSNVDNRSTGEKAKEVGSGVKGLFAAVHGAGEKLRGEFNSGVDRTFHEVCAPENPPFPSFRTLAEEYSCDVPES